MLNILWVIFGISLMLILDLKFRINPMVVLLAAALSVRVLTGIDLMSLLRTMKTGFGNTLGELAIVVVFGTVVGKSMVDSDAAHQMMYTLLACLGLHYVQSSVITIGLIFSPAMLYEVAFIMLAPLVIVIATEAKIPLLKLAVPAIAVTAIAHSPFLPQSGPVALVNAYGADMGMVYIYGVLVTIPSVIYAGLILSKSLDNLERPTPSFLKANQPVDMNNLLSLGVLILVPLIPAIIIISTIIVNIWLVKDTPAREVVNFIGSPPIAVFAAMVVVFVFFGTVRDHDIQWVMNTFESAMKSTAMVILIIGTGGVLKQTIANIGIGDTIDMLMSHGNISPYVMAWLITVLIYLATGQDVVPAMTVAGIISAAILDPATGQLVGVDPALLILATVTDSNILTHISDTSLQLFKGYFDLPVKDVLRTWDLLELVNPVVRLIIVLIISMVA